MSLSRDWIPDYSLYNTVILWYSLGKWQLFAEEWLCIKIVAEVFL
jgi:hypothetical protein